MSLINNLSKTESEFILTYICNKTGLPHPFVCARPFQTAFRIRACTTSIWRQGNKKSMKPPRPTSVGETAKTSSGRMRSSYWWRKSWLCAALRRFVPSYEPSGRNSGVGAASGENAEMPLPNRRRRAAQTAWLATEVGKYRQSPRGGRGSRK